MASPRKSERLISSRGHGCFTISPPQLPAKATRFPSRGSGRPGLVLRTATKLSGVGFEPTAVLTFGLQVRRLNHSTTRSLNLNLVVLLVVGRRLDCCTRAPEMCRYLICKTCLPYCWKLFNGSQSFPLL